MKLEGQPLVRAHQMLSCSDVSTLIEFAVALCGATERSAMGDYALNDLPVFEKLFSGLADFAFGRAWRSIRCVVFVLILRTPT